MARLPCWYCYFYEQILFLYDAFFSQKTPIFYGLSCTTGILSKVESDCGLSLASLLYAKKKRASSSAMNGCVTWFEERLVCCILMIFCISDPILKLNMRVSYHISWTFISHCNNEGRTRRRVGLVWILMIRFF